MAEAVEFQMPIQLRQLFVNICVHCSPNNAQLLFNNNLQHLMEDFTRRGHEDEITKNLALKCIQDMLRHSGHNLEEFQLAVPDFQMIHRLIEEEEDEGSDEFFLDGPGGTGKTFLYNTLINVLEGQGKSVIAVASTRIASILLSNGSTYHSRFKIYPPITETTTSKKEEHHVEAHNIRKASLIIIGEVTMMTVHALDAIDKLFRKVTKSSVAFGGKVLLLGGDFRQCLPVIKHGNRVKIVELTTKSSRTWSDILKLRLSRNMRTAADSVEFANWLIHLGNSTHSRTASLGPDAIEIPQDFLLDGHTEESLVNHVFGDPENLLLPEVEEQITTRAILCPKNDDCLKINNYIIRQMPGQRRRYASMNSIESEDPEEIANFPTEFLDTLKVSGIPPHILELKVGAIIILLKNIDSRQGLCNGTRLIIKTLTDNLIHATIAAGKNKGHNVFIPRMNMSPSDCDLRFKLIRNQFPVLLAFAITINKSQGQTFDKVGIHLPEPVFSHGQLYVGFSRATSRPGVKVLWMVGPKQGKMLKDERVFTQNIVFKEALS
ncbi:uncharacterized protein LOC130704353 [Daphnia carinata]|uniref:uncharacterized protein LOC130704353 n=1 Tax=Daphnia carinata TaxID=120202 RepID=UPI00257CBE03|nr:uncharacterized protein LOC130704353 [Daphnia carinata]